ncbi:MAG: DNA polymerase III subunit gamma/tau [Culicoidibacterales bacterium]
MYKALYRSYRPQTFFDVVGQHHITQTFQNAIVQQKFTHAYLISGPRGTGKTTLAKIFAKAVNCLDLQSNAEPCNQCPVCLGVNDGSLSDIIEIDAASNNGVDEIRELREKAKYAPTLAKYKVYIIDEVHMLSTGAFNALLKTLEEPPKHVIFILATTELHKIPVTIISRCQRFEVKKMTEIQIIERLNFVLTQEQIEFEQDAMALIARVSDGGMRDALSLLDQVISYCSGKITLHDVYDVAGIATADQVQAFLVSLNEQNDEQILKIIEQIFEAGKDLTQFIEQLLFMLRDLLIAKTQTGLKEHLILVKSMDVSFLYQAIDTFNTCQHQLKYTSFPRLALETTAIQFMYPTQIQKNENTTTRQEAGMQKKIQKLQEQMQDLVSQVEQLEKKLKEAPIQNKFMPIVAQKPKVILDDYTDVYRILAQATLYRDTQSIAQLQQFWSTIQKKANHPEFTFLIDSVAKAAIESEFVIATRFEHVKEQLENQETRKKLEKYLREMFGRTLTYTILLEEEWQQLREQFASKWKNKEVTEVTLQQLTKVIPQNDEEKIETVENIESEFFEGDHLLFDGEYVQNEQQDDIIITATDLFGDIVEVI